MTVGIALDCAFTPVDCVELRYSLNLLLRVGAIGSVRGCKGLIRRLLRFATIVGFFVSRSLFDFSAVESLRDLRFEGAETLVTLGLVFATAGIPKLRT